MGRLREKYLQMLLGMMRHHGFDTVEEFNNKELLRTDYAGWIMFGSVGAMIAWESDGLRRVAQWSHIWGLHVFTEDLHSRCLRIVCPLVQAQRIVERIRELECRE
jgi:hypothetical protein